MMGKIVIFLLALSVFLCGCTTTRPKKRPVSSRSPQHLPVRRLTLIVNTSGTTPVTVRAVPAGNHTVEIRERGYTNWSSVITVPSGGTVPVSSSLVPVTVSTPTTAPTIKPVVAKKESPELHVDGYWTYPAVRSYSNPIVLFVHAEGANVGTADARVVTSSANLYYNEQQLCWTKIYFGTIKAGGHATKDTMMSCTLPAGADDHDIVIKFENVVVTP